LFTNKLPFLHDSSGAFEKRCIFLSMPNTFYGREDTGLMKRIKSEMSGILNWAIWGKFQLMDKGGRIEQPESGLRLKRQMLSITAPVQQFLNDRVDVSSSQNVSVALHDVYEVYCSWCSDNNVVKKLDEENFRHAIHDINPNIEIQLEHRGTRRESRIIGMQIRSMVLEEVGSEF